MPYQLYQAPQPLADAGTTAVAATATGFIVGLAALEAYVLYRVWKSRGQKDWPWYVLGSVVGVNVLSKTVLGAAAGMLTAKSW